MFALIPLCIYQHTAIVLLSRLLGYPLIENPMKPCNDTVRSPFTLEIYFEILFRNKTFEIFLESEYIPIGNKFLKSICKQHRQCFIRCL